MPTPCGKCYRLSLSGLLSGPMTCWFLFMAFVPGLMACTPSESSQTDPVTSSLDSNIDGGLPTDARVVDRGQDGGPTHFDAGLPRPDMMALRDALVIQDGGSVVDAGVMPDVEIEPADRGFSPDANLLDVDRDGDGVSVRQGDCDDNDPQIAPGLMDIINDGIDQDCDGFDLHSCTDDVVYQAVIVEDWRVCLDRSIDEIPQLGMDVRAQLSGDLQRIVNTLPPAAVARLREVRLWVERDHPDWGGAVYHPSPQWLINNGYPTYWARGVQIANVRHYLEWTNIQPAIVLHELAHAWHHQVLGYGDVAVLEAFSSAMESGIYDRVEHADGTFRRAYATTNVQEYYAELTEAYFWNNDFFPFHREQLAEFDVRGFELMESSWHHLDP